MEVRHPPRAGWSWYASSRRTNDFGVPEYWHIDVDADRVEIYGVREGGCEEPLLLSDTSTLESSLLPGFVVSVDELVPSPAE
jgi:Uma2 family endonuclease